MASEYDGSGLAIAYRRLVLWFGAQLILGSVRLVLWPFAGEGLAGSLMDLVVILGSLAITVALVIYAYRTAVALGSTVGWLWGVAMLVPLLSLVILLVLSARATRACRAHGVPVGFFGPQVPVASATP